MGSLSVRVSRWSAVRPGRLDAVVAGVLAALTVPAATALAGRPGLLLSAGLVAPLAVRRRHPVIVTAGVAAVAVAQLALLAIPLPADLAVPLAVYTVAAHVGARAVRLVVLIAAAGGAVAAGFRWSTPPEYRANAIAAAVVLAVIAGLVWVVGNLVRGRVSAVRDLSAARRQHERVAAAREIHDIVAHSLTVVIVQADAGRFAPDPRTVLDTIGTAARSALGDVKALIDMLRDEPAAPGDEALSQLIEAVRRAGLPVQLNTSPAALTGLSAPIHTAVLRVVQESLTNVLKHAAPTSTADVTVTRTASTVTIRVTNRPEPPPAAAPSRGPAGGHGIAGMRERVAELGGTLSAGPHQGGFLVEAAIPVAGG